jgi:hypothetical protein
MVDHLRKQVRLKVIPEPDHNTPALRIIETSSGNDTYEAQTLNEEPRLSCGACDHVFFVGIYPDTLQDRIFHCPNCGADNVADPLDDQRRRFAQPTV